VLLFPVKDGHLFLVDAAHLGTVYDRKKLVDICGTSTDPCDADWAGMIVTQPAVADVGGAPLVMVPTFMPDRTHPAGVVGLRVGTRDGHPALDVAWQAPSFDDPIARMHFRGHPSRIEAATFGDETYAWIVEPAVPPAAGTLTAIRARDGAIVLEAKLAGPGLRFMRPLVQDGIVYVTSCVNGGAGSLEAYRIVSPR